MPMTTVKINCPANTWTLVSAGLSTCFLKPRVSNQVYLYVGSSAPGTVPPSFQDFMTVSAGSAPALADMLSTDNVYVCPVGSSAIDLEVIRG